MDKKVRNISDEPQAIEGVGIVMPGTSVLVPSNFHNANFEEVESKPRRKEAAADGGDITKDND